MNDEELAFRFVVRRQCVRHDSDEVCASARERRHLAQVAGESLWRSGGFSALAVVRPRIDVARIGAYSQDKRAWHFYESTCTCTCTWRVPYTYTYTYTYSYTFVHSFVLLLVTESSGQSSE
jgi:hypothetical protein